MKTQILEEIYSLGVCSRRVVAMLIADRRRFLASVLLFAATVTLGSKPVKTELKSRNDTKIKDVWKLKWVNVGQCFELFSSSGFSHTHTCSCSRACCAFAAFSSSLPKHRTVSDYHTVFQFYFSALYSTPNFGERL